jgi:hypothetical protein
MAAPYLVVFAPEATAEVTAIAAWWHKHRLSAPGLFQEGDRARLQHGGTESTTGIPIW